VCIFLENQHNNPRNQLHTEFVVNAVFAILSDFYTLQRPLRPLGQRPLLSFAEEREKKWVSSRDKFILPP